MSVIVVLHVIHDVLCVTSYRDFSTGTSACLSEASMSLRDRKMGFKSAG